MQDERDFGQALGANGILAERAFLASIVQPSDDAIIGTTLDGTMLSWNAAAERMYGFCTEKVLGKSIRMIVPTDRHRELHFHCVAVWKGRTPCVPTVDGLPTFRSHCQHPVSVPQ